MMDEKKIESVDSKKVDKEKLKKSIAEKKKDLEDKKDHIIKLQHSTYNRKM